jgi:hypothetical protein
MVKCRWRHLIAKTLKTMFSAADNNSGQPAECLSFGGQKYCQRVVNGRA